MKRKDVLDQLQISRIENLPVNLWRYQPVKPFLILWPGLFKAVSVSVHLEQRAMERRIGGVCWS
jgi:hypothetical protein